MSGIRAGRLLQRGRREALCLGGLMEIDSLTDGIFEEIPVSRKACAAIVLGLHRLSLSSSHPPLPRESWFLSPGMNTVSGTREVNPVHHKTVRDSECVPHRQSEK